jgi:uncharacterized protein (DUF58 family)
MISKTPSVPAGNRLRPGHFVNPEALMSIKNLELRAKVVVEGLWNGLHRSPYHGFSVEFTEYRSYSPGDDPRYLDWRLSARTDRYYVKKYLDETNLRCVFLVDTSSSMAYASKKVSKQAYANTLAATLAYFLTLQGDAVGLMTFDDKVRDYLPPRSRLGHLRHLMIKLDNPATGTNTDLAVPFQRVLEMIRRRSMVILISDFLGPLTGLEKNLVSLLACGHETLLFQISDPAELSFDFNDAVLFQDVESGRELYIDPGHVRQDYLQRFGAHVSSIQSACAAQGVAFQQVSTERPLELVLFDFLRARMQRGRRVPGRRRGPA